MKGKMLNKTHVEGYLYDHNLEEKVTGENSKNPGTKYIRGTISIATDEDCMNVINITFVYATPPTGNSKGNTYNILASILNGTLKTVIADGKQCASCLKFDSNIGLNEFYSDKSGSIELVSAKINQGGFANVISANVLDENPNNRSTWDADMVIVKVRDVPADPECDTPHQAIVSGYVFDYNKNLLPVDFVAVAPNAIKWFLKLDVSESHPYFTKIWGNQISRTVVKKTDVKSAFEGGDAVKTTVTSQKMFTITGVAEEPYIFGSEEFLTKDELQMKLANREIMLSDLKSRFSDRKSSSKPARASGFGAAPSNSGYDF